MPNTPSETSTTEGRAQDPQASEVYQIETLRQDTLLWYKLHVFMYDLRHFDNPDCSSRLNQIIDLSFVGLPYFTETESDRIKKTVVDPSKSRTLQMELDDFFTKRVEKRLNERMLQTGDYRVCTGHDLAPIFERAFGVNGKDLSKNKSFLSLVRKGGLVLKDGKTWKGLGKNKR